MRCLSCNTRLSNRESTRKYSSSGTFIDLCDRCFGYIAEDVPVIEEDIGNDPYALDDFDDDLDKANLTEFPDEGDNNNG